MLKKVTICICLILLLIIGCSKGEQNNQETLHISAAISLNEVLEEVKPQFEAQYDVALKFQFGGSGKLAQQITQGADADIFISANEDWMEYLITEGFIKEDTYAPIISNELVIIKSKDVPLASEDIHSFPSNIKQIAIGNPESVPAGKYAEEALRNMGIWLDLNEKIILTQDVRQVLTYVETKNAEVGIVYKSDAYLSDAVDIVTEIDPSLYDSIQYPSGILSSSNETELANEFLQFLTTAPIQQKFKQYGFSEWNDG